MVEHVQSPHPGDTAPSPPARGAARPAPRAASRESVSPRAFAIGVFLTVVLTKAVSYLTPYKLYFSFSSFLYSERSLFRWEALAIKLLIPAIVGFVLYYVPFQWMRATGGGKAGYRSVYRYLALQADPTARTVGFFSALLLAWPFVVYWDVLMAPTMLHLRVAFLCIYLLYFVSYAYFASLGVYLAQFAVRQYLPVQVRREAIGRLGWLNAIRTSTLGIVTSAIATYLAAHLGGAQ